VRDMARAFDLNPDLKMVCYDNGNISFVQYYEHGYGVITLGPDDVIMMKKMLKSV
jgi:hypothetical protein